MQNEKNVDDGFETVLFRLEGLSCWCEAQMVEKRIKAVKGVKSFNINPITFKLKLTYDPALMSVSDIQQSVSKAGVKAILLG